MVSRIPRLFAWVAEEGDGGESVILGLLPDVATPMPLISADLEQMEAYRAYATTVATRSGCTVRLKAFAVTACVRCCTPPASPASTSASSASAFSTRTRPRSI
jgi:hypothetical protein